MEVELYTCESFLTTILSTHELGIESLEILTLLVDSHLNGVSVPVHLNITFLIGVNFLEVVSCGSDVLPALSFQVDWTLIFTSAFVVINFDFSPVCSVLFVVPCRV